MVADTKYRQTFRGLGCRGSSWGCRGFRTRCANRSGGSVGSVMPMSCPSQVRRDAAVTCGTATRCCWPNGSARPWLGTGWTCGGWSGRPTFLEDAHQRGLPSAVRALASGHHYIPPRAHTWQSDVETVHRLVEEEFFDREKFGSKREFWGKVTTYGTTSTWRDRIGARSGGRRCGLCDSESHDWIGR